MYCPNCGNQTQPADVFCENCGTRLHEQEPQKKPKNEKVLICTLIGVIALLCIIISIVAALLGNKNEASGDSEKNTYSVTDEYTENNVIIAESTTVPETAAMTQTTTETLTQTTVASIDYSKYTGSYYKGNTETGPCYLFDLISVDKSTNTATFSICYVGYNFSPLYETETLTATIDSNGSASFSWTDSWENEGIGTFTIVTDVTYRVDLKMTVTKESDLNRATLGTDGFISLYPTSV